MPVFPSRFPAAVRFSAALLMVALLVACKQPVAPEEPIRAVKVITIGASAFGSEAEFSAEVRARVESRLGFRVAGKIIRRQAELGRPV